MAGFPVLSAVPEDLDGAARSRNGATEDLGSPAGELNGAIEDLTGAAAIPGRDDPDDARAGATSPTG